MSKGRLFVVAMLWATSLLSVGLWAQAGRGEDQVQIRQRGQPYGPVISAENIGFQRVYSPGEKSGTITGHFVIKVDGVWLEAVAPPNPVRMVPTVH